MIKLLDRPSKATTTKPCKIMLIYIDVRGTYVGNGEAQINGSFQPKCNRYFGGWQH